MSSEMWRFEVRAESLEVAECVIAEVWAAGSVGVEDEGLLLRVYAPADAVEAVRAAALQWVDAEAIAEAAPVDAVDWSEEWKRGLKAERISERLMVRPPFVTQEVLPGQLDLVIEPGQAFGTGSHASTRLSLEWIDLVCAGLVSDAKLPPAARVLDVGTGSAVLAMAAVGLTPDASAIGVDLDAVAIEEARETLVVNGMEDRIELRVGSLESLTREGEAFDLVVANLLRKSEVTPLLPEIAACLRPGALAIFSGLLSSEGDAMLSLFDRVGLDLLGRRALPDESRKADAEADDWIGLLARRR